MAQTEYLESGHHDRVTVLHINFDGSKILTASIDHRIKVWNVEKSTGRRSLIDTFSAHDADIRDAKWLHPTTGTHIASVGNDLKFCLWQEDAYQQPNSGRRFRRICTIPSTPRVPFVSLDIKNVDHLYTFLALIDRQGLLSIYEPTNPDEFQDWTLIDQFNVCVPAPGRGEETSFKVRFDQNAVPLAYMSSVSDERKQLSLVVTAMNEVKIFRSVLKSSNGPDDSDGASHRFMFHEALRLPTHPALVRDVQWAPFNVRGADLIATACRDGSVRIFELSVAGSASDTNTTGTTSRVSHQSTTRQQPQSSLTSAITGRNQTSTPSTTTNTTTDTTPPSHSARAHDFPFTTQLRSTTLLEHVHNDAWALAWDPQGQVLISSGADGVTKLWRKSVLAGQWLLFADQALDEASAEEDEGEE